MAETEDRYVFRTGRPARASGLAYIGFAIIIALMIYVFFFGEPPPGEDVQFRAAQRMQGIAIMSLMSAGALAAGIWCLLVARNTRVVMREGEIVIRDWRGREQSVSLDDVNAMMLRWRWARWARQSGWVVLELLRSDGGERIARIWTPRFWGGVNPPEECTKLTAAIAAKRPLYLVDENPNWTALHLLFGMDRRRWR